MRQASQAATQGDALLAIGAGDQETRAVRGWLFLAALPYKEDPKAQADLLGDLRAARRGALSDLAARLGYRGA